jgi:hypothetical protein
LVAAARLFTTLDLEDKRKKNLEAVKEYQRSERGRATIKAYKQSEARRESDRKYRKSAKGKLGRRRKLLRDNYGMTLEHYEALKNKQNNLCAVCGNEQPRRPLDVDHCHATNKIRGLLCNSCNVGLGAFKDSFALLEKAAIYLRFWSAS